MPVFDPSKDGEVDAMALRMLFSSEMITLTGEPYPDPALAKRLHDERMEMFRQKIDAHVSSTVAQLSRDLEQVFQRRLDHLRETSGNTIAARDRITLAEGRFEFFRSGQFLLRFHRMPRIEMVDDCYSDIAFHGQVSRMLHLDRDGKLEVVDPKIQVSSYAILDYSSRGLSDEQIVDEIVLATLKHELLHYGSRAQSQQIQDGLYVATSGLVSSMFSFQNSFDNVVLGGIWAEEAMVDWLRLQIDPDSGSAYPNNVAVLQMLEGIVPGLVEGAFDASFRGIHKDFKSMIFPSAELVLNARMISGMPTTIPVDKAAKTKEDVFRISKADPFLTNPLVPDSFWSNVGKWCHDQNAFRSLYDEIDARREKHIADDQSPSLHVPSADWTPKQSLERRALGVEFGIAVKAAKVRDFVR